MSGQTVYLIFAEQISPIEAEERIDPLVGIVSDEAECFRLEKEHPEYTISWEERDVDDAGEHAITSGDTVFVYHYLATIRPTADGGEVLDVMSRDVVLPPRAMTPC